MAYILCTRTREAGEVTLSCKVVLAMMGSKVVTMAGKPGTLPEPMIPERLDATSLQGTQLWRKRILGIELTALHRSR